jgi:ParB/RepB/Spo0J family partition protein
MGGVTTMQPQTARVAELGERLGALRLCEAAALEAMQRSLSRKGQLTPVVVFEERGQLEVLDGFKRLRAAQALGWATVGIVVADVGSLDAKIRLAELHKQRGLSELEEGWLVRSLHREDRLPQSEIARRLDRHKSWVCRRLMLVETLDTAVQGDVRLGLLCARAAVVLGALPRGNQPGAAQVVIRRGLTVRQVELWVAQLVDLADNEARTAEIARRLDAAEEVSPPKKSPRAVRNEAEWMAADIATVRRVSARLQARLLGTPLLTLGLPAAEVLREGLVHLAPVLAALGRTVAVVLDEEVCE